MQRNDDLQRPLLLREALKCWHPSPPLPRFLCLLVFNTCAYDCNSMNGNCGQLGFFAQQGVDFSLWKSSDPVRSQGPSHDSRLLHSCFSFNVPLQLLLIAQSSEQWASSLIYLPLSQVITNQTPSSWVIQFLKPLKSTAPSRSLYFCPKIYP